MTDQLSLLEENLKLLRLIKSMLFISMDWNPLSIYPLFIYWVSQHIWLSPGTAVDRPFWKGIQSRCPVCPHLSASVLQVPRTPCGSGTPVRLLQHWGALPGPKSGSCLTLGMNCLRRHTCWQSSSLHWEGPRVDSGRVRGPGGLLCRVARRAGFYGDGISFPVVSGQSVWLRVLPAGTGITQPRWMPARRILGGW